MSNEELVALIKQKQDVKTNMLLLWKQVELLAVSIAKKYRGRAEIEDLKQEGFIALYSAIEGYKEEEGMSFANYAALHMQSRMKRYTYGTSGVFIPEHMQIKLWNYKKAVSDFEKKHARLPEKAEIREITGFDDETLASVLKADIMAKLSSLDKEIETEDDTTTLGAFIASPTNMEEEMLENNFQEQLGAELWRMVGDLDEKYSAIIKARYKDGLTLPETADKLGKDFVETRAAELRAMRKLRTPKNLGRLTYYMAEYVEGLAYRHVSAGAFHRNGFSSTEKAALNILGEM